MFGSTQKSFIHTPISISSTEPLKLAFTTKVEDSWISKVHDLLVSENGAKKLKSIVNSTDKGDPSSKIL